MKKYLTPWFLISILVLLFAVYIFLFEQPGWGTLLVTWSIPVSILVLMLDLLLKVVLDDLKKVFILEIAVSIPLIIALLIWLNIV